MLLAPLPSGTVISENLNSSMIYVDDDNRDGPWDGSEQFPYKTIQDGIDSALIYDTIYVKNGVYEEHIFINKTVTLMGEDKNQTIIDGSYTKNVVICNADEIYLSNFSVSKSGDLSGYAGIWINSDNNVITNNIISQNKGYGMYFQNADENTVSHNLIVHNERSGICLWSSSHQNTIQNNMIRQNEQGIYIGHSNDVHIIANTIKNCDTGILLSPSSNNTVEGNNMVDNTNGISLHTSSDNTIMKNVISENEKAIILTYGSDNQVSFNELTNNSLGIDVFESANCEIINNNFIDNKNHAYFSFLNLDFAFFTKPYWRNNYWGKARVIPYVIIGDYVFYLIDASLNWYNVDWNPASNPFNYE